MASVASTLLTALMGKVAGIAVDAVFSEVTQTLGIQTQSSRVVSELDQIQSELTQINQALNAIGAGVTEIQQQLTDNSYQELLGKYEDNRSVIVENFASITNLMNTMNLSTDTTVQQKCVDEFNQLLSIDNANLVAEALNNVQTALAGDPDVGYQGLIPYQQQIILDQISSYWSNTENYIVPGMDGPQPAFRHGQTTRQNVPNPNSVNYGGRFYDNFKPYTGTPGLVLAPVFNNTVVKVFTSMLTTQAQAFWFLYLAFNNGPQQPQLQTITSNLNAQLQTMQNMFTSYTTPGGAYDSLVNSIFNQLATTSSGYLSSMYPSWDDDEQSWPYGDGWRFADGANLPGAGARHAVLYISSADFSQPQTIVWFNKKANWAGSNPRPGYVEPVILGWQWSGENNCQLQSAAGYAAGTVNPIMHSFLDWWLSLNQPQAVAA